jgi:hypothetical protein
MQTGISYTQRPKLKRVPARAHYLQTILTDAVYTLASALTTIPATIPLYRPTISSTDCIISFKASLGAAD